VEGDLLSVGLDIPDEMPLKWPNFKHFGVLLQDLFQNILRFHLLDHKNTNHKDTLSVVSPALG
jgi:hypothetical protein